MAQMEQRELDCYRQRLAADVRDLFEKYRSIFEWDVPEIDVAASNQLILAAIRQTLDAVEQSRSRSEAP